MVSKELTFTNDSSGKSLDGNVALRSTGIITAMIKQ